MAHIGGPLHNLSESWVEKGNCNWRTPTSEANISPVGGR